MNGIVNGIVELIVNGIVNGFVELIVIIVEGIVM